MTPVDTYPTKIMIIRHAEKPLLTQTPPVNGVTPNGDIDQDSLIVQGWQRAGALAVLFAPARGQLQDPRLQTPNFIYSIAPPSSDPDNDEGNRPEQTVAPLIAKLTTPGGAVTTNFEFGKDSGVQLIDSVLGCGGVVLICWPHGQIPDVAKQIPLSQNNTQPLPTGKWPGDRFDMVWVFDEDNTEAGHYTFSQVPELLLAGDSPYPINGDDSKPNS